MSLDSEPTAYEQKLTGAPPAVVGSLIGLAYLAAGILGPWIHANPERVITPAAGVALAALVAFGLRYAFVVWIAAAIVGVVTGMPVVASILTGGVCALAAWLGALFLRPAAGFRLLMDRVRDVAAFAVLGVLASPAFGAFLGGPVLMWTGQIPRDNVGYTIMGWWMSDAVGILLVTPLLLALAVDRRRGGWPRAWPVEGALGLAATMFIAVALFGGRAPPEVAEAALLLPLPLLLWGVFRFGLHGVAAVMAIMAGVIVWRAGEGYGLLAAAGAAGNIPLWIYTITLGLVALVTWALVAEHRSALQRFEAVFQDSSDGIILFDQGRVAHCNPAAVFLFGSRAPERLVGRDVTELSPPRQPDGQSSKEAMREHMLEADKLGENRIEWTLERYDGTTFPAEIGLSSVVVGGAPGHLAVIRDMSDQVAKEEELVRERDQAEAAHRAKTAYLADVSHRIRTALNTNLGFARMIARDATLPSQHKQYVQKVLTSGEALLELVDDVLETSKIEADRMGASVPSAFDPRRLLSELTAKFQMRAREKDLFIGVNVGDEVPERIVAERRKLDEVLTVLMGNAVKATSGGSVSVRMTLGEGGDDAEGVPLVIEVADTGPGLAPEEMPGLFEQREHPEGAHAPGLYEAREIARALGGDLTAVSQPGEGTTLHLKVEWARAGEADLVDDGPAGPTRLAPGQTPPKILIVDDTEENRVLVQGLLTRVGFETRMATDGREAITAFADWQPDLILMDQKMPTMDGTEATRRIKASEGGGDTPIVMVTAAGFGADEEEIMAGGADGFVRVPFHETELLREIQRLLGVEYDREG